MAYDKAYLAEIFDFIRSQQDDGAAESALPTAAGEEEGGPDEPDLDDRFETPMSLETIFEQFGKDTGAAAQADTSDALESLIPGPPTSADTFASFFDRLGIRNFHPGELLVLGGNKPAGRARDATTCRRSGCGRGSRRRSPPLIRSAPPLATRSSSPTPTGAGTQCLPGHHLRRRRAVQPAHRVPRD